MRIYQVDKNLIINFINPHQPSSTVLHCFCKLPTVTATADSLQTQPHVVHQIGSTFDAAGKADERITHTCREATFARDARTLVDAGFELTSVLPVDQFVWSPHIELVGVFRR